VVSQLLFSRDHARLQSREKSRLARLVSREVSFSQKSPRDLARPNSSLDSFPFLFSAMSPIYVLFSEIQRFLCLPMRYT